eukprot:344714-Chlamydomonas_euryale.AAC.3
MHAITTVPAPCSHLDADHAQPWSLARSGLAGSQGSAFLSRCVLIPIVSSAVFCSSGYDVGSATERRLPSQQCCLSTASWYFQEASFRCVASSSRVQPARLSLSTIHLFSIYPFTLSAWQ